MGIPVLILGESGSGKSASLRNFKPGEILIFNVANKPLPFREKLDCLDKSGYRAIFEEFKSQNTNGMWWTTANIFWRLNRSQRQRKTDIKNLRIWPCTSTL